MYKRHLLFASVCMHVLSQRLQLWRPILKPCPCPANHQLRQPSAPLFLYPSAPHDKGDAVAAPTVDHRTIGISEASSLPSFHLAELMLVKGMVCM